MDDDAPQPSSDSIFPGFDKPEQNWFRLPNIWTDITADITSLAELKVIEYVLKHTWGYQEYGVIKRITTDEFMSGRRRTDGTRIDRGTGLSKPSVIAGLKSAVAHGYLVEVVDAADLARIKKYYSLKMQPGAKADDEPIPAQNPPPAFDAPSENSGVKDLNADVKNLYIGGNLLNIWGKESLHRSEKDTLERNKQTDIKSNNNIGTVALEDDVVVALLKQGISQSVAQRLAQKYPVDYISLKQDYLEFLIAHRPHEVKKPAAWLRKAIEDDYSAPDGFFSHEDRRRYSIEENDQNQAVLAAYNHEREQVASDENNRVAETAAMRQRLHAQYGTTNEDLAFWEIARTDLSYTGQGGVYELVANAEMLKVTDDHVILGIPHRLQFQKLQHPGYQTALKRMFKQLTRRRLELELVLVGEDSP